MTRPARHGSIQINCNSSKTRTELLVGRELLPVTPITDSFHGLRECTLYVQSGLKGKPMCITLDNKAIKFIARHLSDKALAALASELDVTDIAALARKAGLIE